MNFRALLFLFLFLFFSPASEAREPVRALLIYTEKQAAVLTEEGRDPLLNYRRALEAGGFEVAACWPGNPPRPDSVHAVVLPGGNDVDAVFYGVDALTNNTARELEFDCFEMAVLDAALGTDPPVPVLAVCRGMQLLNVWSGGTLHRSLSDGQEAAVVHRGFSGDLYHLIRMESSSRLGESLGSVTKIVNSYHFQGIDRPGTGLRVTARAPDGVIEAVEREGGGFVLGVQFHPERLTARDPLWRKLFDLLFREAVRYQKKVNHEGI